MLGAVVMGIRHGMFCMGCCAALMLLLFAVAVMDLRWVVALTILVTSEKLLPGAKLWRLTIAVGFIAAAAGLVILRSESGITQNSAAAEFLVVRVLTLTMQQTSTIWRRIQLQGSPCARELPRRAAILYQQWVAECRFRGLQRVPA